LYPSSGPFDTRNGSFIILKYKTNLLTQPLQGFSTALRVSINDKPNKV